jgi:hypothetical protein
MTLMRIRSTLKDYFPVILAFAIIAGCARMSAPTGGPRDRKAPVVVKNTPANGEKNFKGHRITITFDEYVVLDKINEKFMVSPPMSKKPRVFLKGKNVVVEYEDELRDSTTYTFYFQDAIRDLNEGNTINNYQFVFSTGPVIDSLSVTGNVYTALSLDPPEETLVMLYREMADSAFNKHLPDYISRADKKGYFRIDNVKEGKYRLYALKDADNSKNFNLPDEEIAFMNTPVEITAEKNYLPVPEVKDTVKVTPAKATQKKTTQRNIKTEDTVIKKGEYKLILFQPPKKMHYLTSSSRSAPYKLAYTLSLPPDTMRFDFTMPGAGGENYMREESREKDTILIWLTDSALFSQPQITTLVSYPYTDTTGKTGQKQDTIMMRFLTPRSTRARTRPEPFRVSSNIQTGSLKPGQQIVFKSQTPLRAPDTSKIRLYETEKTGKTKIPFSFSMDTTNSCRMTLNMKPEEGKNYLFIADSAAFGNIYGTQSDSTGNKFFVKSEKSLGTLIMNIKNYQGNRIIQLLMGEDKIVDEKTQKSDGKVEFKYLDQGKYRLRVIYDLNNDGKWTTGDFISGKQPEPVSFFDKEMDVREGWTHEEDWDISAQNEKKLKSTALRTTGTR